MNSMLKAFAGLIWVVGSLAVLAACVAATTAQAASGVVRNGVTWDAAYEADAAPNAETPIWSTTMSGGANGSASGGIWTQGSSDGDYNYSEQTGSSWTGLGAQRTVECRFKAISQTGARAADLSLFINTVCWTLKLATGSASLEGQSTVASATIDNVGQFHTYRVTVDTSLSTSQVVVYADNCATPLLSSGTGLPASYGVNLLRFGDGSSGYGGTSSWDFISWTAGIHPVEFVRNRVAWGATYEADGPPNSAYPAWTVGNSGGSGGASDGVWTQHTTYATGLYAEQTGASWTSLGSQRTVEFSLRVIDQNAADSAVRLDLFLNPAGSPKVWALWFTTNSVQLVGASTAGSATLNTTDRFHVYRVTVDTDLGTDQVKIYVDDRSRPLLKSGTAAAGNYGALDFIRFGDGSGSGIGGTVAFDYFAWTAGVHPFPPTGTCVLLK